MRFGTSTTTTTETVVWTRSRAQWIECECQCVLCLPLWGRQWSRTRGDYHLGNHWQKKAPAKKPKTVANFSFFSFIFFLLIPLSLWLLPTGQHYSSTVCVTRAAAAAAAVQQRCVRQCTAETKKKWKQSRRRFLLYNSSSSWWRSFCCCCYYCCCCFCRISVKDIFKSTLLFLLFYCPGALFPLLWVSISRKSN